jgi:transcriptional regulator with XRE-family HTH domain
VSGKRKRNPVSQAIRDLRECLNISQQELAFRTKMAIRTIARWEGEQPPHGKALLQLADMAQANDLNQIASVFRGALQDEVLINGIGADPGLKPWIEAVNVIFRFQQHEPLLWDRLTSAIIDGVRHITAVTDRGKPDARLSELMATLMESAKLPAEREMDHRFAEEQASGNRDGDRKQYEDWELTRQQEFLVGIPRKDPDQR